MAVAPSASATIYTGSDDARAMVTTDGGLTWSDITHTVQPNGLPIRSITQVAVDPKVSTTAYVTVSGFSGFIGGHQQKDLFQMTERGGHLSKHTRTAAQFQPPHPPQLPHYHGKDSHLEPH